MEEKIKHTEMLKNLSTLWASTLRALAANRSKHKAAFSAAKNRPTLAPAAAFLPVFALSPPGERVQTGVFNLLLQMGGGVLEEHRRPNVRHRQHKRHSQRVAKKLFIAMFYKSINKVLVKLNWYLVEKMICHRWVPYLHPERKAWISFANKLVMQILKSH